MLRSLDERGGIGVYTRYITQELIRIDPHNHYELFYRNKTHIGRFAHIDNVTEHVVDAPNKAVWDQVSIPYACWKNKIDILFHPKFSVPLLAHCKSVMVLHGAGWFMPEFSHFWDDKDLRYARFIMPLYCRKAAAVLAVSQITTETFNNVMDLPDGRIKTVYFAPGKQFRRIDDPIKLKDVKQKYKLPDRFIFTLTGYDRGPRKNVEGILESYRIHHGKTPHKLVVGGKDCHRFREDFSIPDLGYGQDILFPGWIAQEDLPAVYSLADLFLYPSRVEAFPIPITEALACGTPIVTSNANGLKEIAGEAALLVDPDKPAEIAEAVTRVLTDDELRESLSIKSLARSSNFSWDKCARETLDILMDAAT